MKKIGICIFAFDITKGMKSYGSLCLLKRRLKDKELIFHSIGLAKQKFRYEDLCVVLGFEYEKIKKRLLEEKLTSSAKIIYNEKYKEKNCSYAFKLYIKNMLINCQDLDGVLFLNSNLLIKNIPSYSSKKSWILVNKEKTTNNNNISCFIENDKLNFMFYNLTDTIWKEIVYMTIPDLNTIAENIDIYHDNMFMFELINSISENQKIKFDVVFSKSKKDVIKISSVKDKNKIA